MNCWKHFFSAVMAALTASVFVTSASATAVTGPGENSTPSFHLVSEEDASPGNSHVLLHNDIADIECEATFQGDVEKHGFGTTVSEGIEQFVLTGCTGGWTAHIDAPGVFEIHYTSGSNGTVTWSSATWTITRFGVSCRYKAENTHVGTLTGGNPATLHIEAVLPFHSGSFLCGGQSAKWTGAFVTTEELVVDP